MSNRLSLWRVHVQTKRLREQANEIYRHLALQLIELIPAKLNQLASNRGWNRVGSDNWTGLSKLLEEIVASTIEGHATFRVIQEAELEHTGIADLDTAASLLEELKRAWATDVEITIIRDSGPDRIRLEFRAAGITPETDED